MKLDYLVCDTCLNLLTTYHFNNSATCNHCLTTKENN